MLFVILQIPTLIMFSAMVGFVFQIHRSQWEMSTAKFFGVGCAVAAVVVSVGPTLTALTFYGTAFLPIDGLFESDSRDGYDTLGAVILSLVSMFAVAVLAPIALTAYGYMHNRRNASPITH